MDVVDVKRAQPSDAAELIAGNIAIRGYHAPWTTPFVDREGFERWLADTQAERCVRLVARHRATNGIIGVINFTEIVCGGRSRART